MLLVGLGLLAAGPMLLGADDRTRLLALNSLYLAVCSAAIGVPLGTGLAILLLRTDVPGRRTAMLLLAVMLLVPLHVQAAAWQAGFARGGWHWLAISPLDGWRGAIWIHAMAAVPWVTLIAGVGLRLVEPELEEAALLDASPLSVFCRVTLPRAAPLIGVAVLWVGLSTAGEMTVTDLWGLRTYAEEVYLGFALGDTLGEAQLRVLPGVLLVGWLALVALVACHRLSPRIDRPPGRGPWRYRLGVWRWPAAGLLWAITALLIGVPLANLCYKAGSNIPRVGDEFVRTWSMTTLGWNVAASPWRYADELRWSLAIAFPAATAAVVLAVPLAWWARRGGLRSLPALLTTACCLAVPGPIVGLSITWLMNRRESIVLAYLYDRTLVAPWAAVLVRCLPAAVLILWYALKTVPRETLDMAAVDGAGPVTRLVRVALPQRRAAVSVAWLIAFAVAIGDLAASINVLPPGVDSLPRRIFGMLHAGSNAELGSLCLANGALFAVIAGIVWRLCRGRSEE